MQPCREAYNNFLHCGLVNTVMKALRAMMNSSGAEPGLNLRVNLKSFSQSDDLKGKEKYVRGPIGARNFWYIQNLFI